MKKVLGLDNWKRNKNIPDEKRFVEVSIHLTYINIKSILKSSPTERKGKIKQDLKGKLKKLIETNIFDNYELIGTTLKPRGVKAKIPFSSLSKLEKLDFVQNVFIEKIDYARKQLAKKAEQYYCVKMTVAIEIEGRKKGLQTFEERFVIIKASSTENAYNKLEKQKKSYAEPYLNPDAQLVRWRIESLDDCYETGLNNLEDFNNPEGVEVFSILKSRKLTVERQWNGK